MLRIRNRHWGRILFNLWIVGFTAIVVIMYVQLRDVTSNNKTLIKNNKTLIKRTFNVSKQTDFKICTRINNINAIVTLTLLRSKKNLPKLAYFREHPGEMKNQIAQIKQQIGQFKPRECGKEVK